MALDEFFEDCTLCDGDGEVQAPGRHIPQITECPACGGSGKVRDRTGAHSIASRELDTVTPGSAPRPVFREDVESLVRELDRRAEQALVCADYERETSGDRLAFFLGKANAFHAAKTHVEDLLPGGERA